MKTDTNERMTDATSDEIMAAPKHINGHDEEITEATGQAILERPREIEALLKG